mmetsp:Transcript_66173/g.167721  ORF Transcript_66173/g.167721 Transcript_66173/m.167721 type:complete len:256 (-) Transcript_66173:12-779(-)
MRRGISWCWTRRRTLPRPSLPPPRRPLGRRRPRPSPRHPLRRRRLLQRKLWRRWRRMKMTTWTSWRACRRLSEGSPRLARMPQLRPRPPKARLRPEPRLRRRLKPVPMLLVPMPRPRLLRARPWRNLLRSRPRRRVKTSWRRAKASCSMRMPGVPRRTCSGTLRRLSRPRRWRRKWRRRRRKRKVSTTPSARSPRSLRRRASTTPSAPSPMRRSELLARAGALRRRAAPACVRREVVRRPAPGGARQVPFDVVDA